jgi:hypothetical protein
MLRHIVYQSISDETLPKRLKQGARATSSGETVTRTRIDYRSFKVMLSG